jgi:hypothetical protein
MVGAMAFGAGTAFAAGGAAVGAGAEDVEAGAAGATGGMGGFAVGLGAADAVNAINESVKNVRGRYILRIVPQLIGKLMIAKITVSDHV